MDKTGNRSYGSMHPRKASSKSNTGGKKATSKKGKDPTRKDPKYQY